MFPNNNIFSLAEILISAMIFIYVEWISALNDTSTTWHPNVSVVLVSCLTNSFVTPSSNRCEFTKCFVMRSQMVSVITILSTVFTVPMLLSFTIFLTAPLIHDRASSYLC